MPHKRIRKVVGSIISAPSRAGSRRRGARADKARGAVKFLRETKGVPSSPKTDLGRKRISASLIVDDAKRRLKRKKRK